MTFFWTVSCEVTCADWLLKIISLLLVRNMSIPYMSAYLHGTLGPMEAVLWSWGKLTEKTLWEWLKETIERTWVHLNIEITKLDLVYFVMQSIISSSLLSSWVRILLAAQTITVNTFMLKNVFEGRLGDTVG